MAARGVKPKPAQLRLVDGSHRNTRHGKKEKIEEKIVLVGKPEMPEDFCPLEAKTWDRYIACCPWLDKYKEAAAIKFCQLWVVSEERGPLFSPAQHGQLRAYMAELGLTDERNRKMPDAQKNDEFF
jgi:hypothetical protein